MRWKSLAAICALLVLAAALRLPALPAGLPYMSYVDEGHVLHHALHLLAKRTWEPDNYYYGSLTLYLVAGAAVAWSPVYAAIHGHPLSDDLSPSPPRYYDILEPVDLVVIGRLVTLFFSLGVVLLTGLLARRLAGPAAGFFAAWLAAWVPALVARSTIVNVNPLAAFFVLAALIFAEGARDGRHGRRDAILAGAMTGLAAAIKYPA
ncbi:MAG TPA: glycosyltransferase family 39 protein, partial [Thermoanaerobaculia bacterium]|nr:glycosyltransferase family 39 protein [Thermoanaerobaculia bacterium]